MVVVELKNISRHFMLGNNQVNALTHINLTINQGEFLVLKGASGSGKSTLLNIIGIMDQASHGETYIAGKSLNQLSDNQQSAMRKKHIGFIFQSFNLLPVLTALENVQYPLSLQGIKNTKERATIALERVGLGEFIHHKPNQLSGGQMQRVAIARALVTEPDIILADEPTANLDSVSAQSIMTLMTELNQQGITFIFATHHDYVLSKASRIIELKDGAILEDSRKAVA
ncbi:MAG: lipoprotein ABC transporter ATP-binding protein LolD [Gammaproteobacteria bacterium MedPE]|nr:MAG: lipoprotein ABC transporter ATP-binding protein LolD [Gammaproteobacteria bacterium MedPE]